MTVKTYFSVINEKKMVIEYKKWWISFILLLFLSLSNYGLVSAQEVDTLQIEKKNVMETRWMLLDMGWNQFTFTNPNIDNSPLALNVSKSFQFDLNIFRQRISLYRHKLNIEYGFALDFNRYELANSYILQPYSTVVTPEFIDTVSYKRNSLKTISFAVPLLIQFESNPDQKFKSFHVGAGGFLGLNVSAKNIQRTTTREKLNVKGDFNLSSLKYGLQAEIGYSYVTFIYKLNLSSLFIGQQSSGYFIYPMTFGVRLIPHF